MDWEPMGGSQDGVTWSNMQPFLRNLAAAFWTNWRRATWDLEIPYNRKLRSYKSMDNCLTGFFRQKQSYFGEGMKYSNLFGCFSMLTHRSTSFLMHTQINPCTPLVNVSVVFWDHCGSSSGYVCHRLLLVHDVSRKLPGTLELCFRKH